MFGWCHNHVFKHFFLQSESVAIKNIATGSVESNRDFLFTPLLESLMRIVNKCSIRIIQTNYDVQQQLLRLLFVKAICVLQGWRVCSPQVVHRSGTMLRHNSKNRRSQGVGTVPLPNFQHVLTIVLRDEVWQNKWCWSRKFKIFGSATEQKCYLFLNTNVFAADNFDTGIAPLLLHIFTRPMLEISPAANRRSVGVKRCAELRKHIARKKTIRHCN